MRNKFIICLPILFLIVVSSLTAQNKYPSLEKVVDEFFDTYTVENLPQSEYISFAKKTTGWYVLVKDISTGREIVTQEMLFWDQKTNKYQSLKLAKTKQLVGVNDSRNNHLSSWNEYYFNICPYFGYLGWYKDVINEYAKRTNLNDSLLYAVGYAYSCYASSLLNNNTGMAVIEDIFELKSGPDAMTSEQLEKYKYYQHKAIEYYEQVNTLNPDFETIVGQIGTKTANEYLTSFLYILIYQNEKEARKEIKVGLYSEFMIATAKNYLNSYEPNAIIFTNGDNDTYPLLYVQAQYGFRTDVLVINLSLLNTDWYADYVKREVFDAESAPISLSHDQYKQGTRDVVYLIDDEDDKDYLNIVNLFDTIHLNPARLKYPTINGDVDFFPTTKFYLPVDKAKVMSSGTVPQKWAGEVVDSVNWTINHKVLQKSSLFVLDILAHFNWDRPICFAITTGSEAFMGLDDYLSLEGLVYRLVPTRAENPDESTGRVNTDVMYNNMMNKFNWGNLTSNRFYPSENDLRFMMNYRNNFTRLATALLDEGKKDSAIAVMDKVMALMPDETVPFDYFVLPIAEAYYRADELEKGNTIMFRLTDIFNAKLEHIFSLDISQQASLKIEIQQGLYILQRIVQSAELKKQDALLEYVKPKFEYYFALYLNDGSTPSNH